MGKCMCEEKEWRMKKINNKSRQIILMIGMIFCLLFDVMIGQAEEENIPIDGTYVEGIITSLESETMSAEENEVYRYSFQLEEPGQIDLHFITRVNRMRFQIRDQDENIILDDYIEKEENPKDYSLVLSEGKYTIHIIKIAPTGGFGIQVSEDNVGEYKFKIEYEPFSSEKGDEGIVSVNKNYESFFESKNNNDTVEKVHQLEVAEEGEYIFGVTSEMNMNFSFRDEEENIVVDGNSLGADMFKQEVRLLEGTYHIICDSSESGKYQLLVEKKKDKVEEKKEDEAVAEEKESWIDKIFSPSTFVGAILVGVIVAFIAKKMEG